MFPWLDAAGALSGIVGMFGADAAERRAEAARQAALTQYGQAYDRQYQNILGNNASALAQATGGAGDYLRTLGSDLGAANANAGIYNSSATAGALARANLGAQSNLANLAGQNYQNAQAYWNQGQQNLANMRLGAANQDLGYARQDAAGAAAGLGSALGAFQQYLQPAPTSDPNIAQGGEYPQMYPGLPQRYPDWRQVGPFPAAPSPYPNAYTGAYGYPRMDPALSLPSLQTPGLGMGFPSSLGQVGQSNLALSGANAYRSAMPLMNGTMGQAGALPGNDATNPYLRSSIAGAAAGARFGY